MDYKASIKPVCSGMSMVPKRPALVLRNGEVIDELGSWSDWTLRDSSHLPFEPGR